MPSDGERTVTRAELHEMVWTTPIVRLAKQLGYSDVGLTKLCRRENVPTPPRGYWARLKAGNAPKRAPLPRGRGREATITLLPSPRATLAVAQPATTAAKAKALLEIDVPETLADPHPLVERTQRRLAAAARRLPLGARERISPIDDGERFSLDVCVTPHHVDRALCVLDATCKALEAQGATIETIGSGHSERWTSAVRGQDSVDFALVENMTKVPYRPTRSERREAERYPHLKKLPEWAYEPDGTLRFEFRSSRTTGTPRRRSERGTSDPSKWVGRFVAAALEELDLVREYRVERERCERERDAEHRRWFEEQESRRRLEAARDGVLRDVANWRHACEIRAFVAAATDALTATSSSDERGVVPAWIQTALEVADSLDPLHH